MKRIIFCLLLPASCLAQKGINIHEQSNNLVMDADQTTIKKGILTFTGNVRFHIQHSLVECDSAIKEDGTCNVAMYNMKVKLSTNVTLLCNKANFDNDKKIALIKDAIVIDERKPERQTIADAQVDFSSGYPKLVRS